jgi:hypothetical protein
MTRSSGSSPTKTRLALCATTVELARLFDHAAMASAQIVNLSALAPRGWLHTPVLAEIAEDMLYSSYPQARSGTSCR